MSAPERRPHIVRQCPVPGCDATFITSWWEMHAAGIPLPVEVPYAEVEVQVTTHITLAHATTPISYFT